MSGRSNLYPISKDFDKAFDNTDRNTLYRIIPKWHGFPQKMVNVIEIRYEGFHCRVMCGNHISDPFDVQNGVKTGMHSVASTAHPCHWLDDENEQ